MEYRTSLEIDNVFPFLQAGLGDLLKMRLMLNDKVSARFLGSDIGLHALSASMSPQFTNIPPWRRRPTMSERSDQDDKGVGKCPVRAFATAWEASRDVLPARQPVITERLWMQQLFVGRACLFPSLQV